MSLENRVFDKRYFLLFEDNCIVSFRLHRSQIRFLMLVSSITWSISCFKTRDYSNDVLSKHRTGNDGRSTGFPNSFRPSGILFALKNAVIFSLHKKIVFFHNLFILLTKAYVVNEIFVREVIYRLFVLLFC